MKILSIGLIVTFKDLQTVKGHFSINFWVLFRLCKLVASYPDTSSSYNFFEGGDINNGA